MITGAQIRRARELVGWKRSTLATRARIRLAALIRAEGTDGLPAVSASEAERMQKAFEAAGVLFTGGERSGVKLRKSS